MQAIKIALLLKKWLVDHDIFDLHQEDLEQHMFRCIQEQGFTDVEISRFKLVNRFKQSRNPLVVFLCGLPCDTKTRLAQELSHRLHVPNVLRTDDIEEILKCHPSVVAAAASMTKYCCSQTYTGEEGMIIETYKRECQRIQNAMEHDVLKAFKDGKSIIIEGYHLDPEYIIQEYSGADSARGVENQKTHLVTLFRQGYGPLGNRTDGHTGRKQDDTAAADFNEGKKIKNDGSKQQCALVIPILLHMDHDQYSIDSQSWNLSYQSSNQQDVSQMVSHRQRVHSTIGEYLQQTCVSHEIPTLHVDMVDWNRALEDIHEYILQGIEMVMT